MCGSVQIMVEFKAFPSEATPWCCHWSQHPDPKLHLQDSTEHSLITPPWQVLISKISIFQELSTAQYDLRWESFQLHCSLWCLILPVLTASTLMSGIYLWSSGDLMHNEKQKHSPPRKEEREKKEKKTQLFNRILFYSLSWQGASALYPGSPKSPENFLAHISENRFGIGVMPSPEWHKWRCQNAQRCSFLLRFKAFSWNASANLLG